MRIFCMSMFAHGLSSAVFLAVITMGCTTWIADHQGVPSENSGGSSSVGEQSSMADNSTNGVPTSSLTSTTEHSISATDHADLSTSTSTVSDTSNPSASVPDPSTMSGDPSSADSDTENSSDSTADASSTGEDVCSPDDVLLLNNVTRICNTDVRFVFLTADKVHGNMNGKKPDEVCNDAADEAAEDRPLKGKFRAWVSYIAEAPADWQFALPFSGKYVKYDLSDGAANNSVSVVAETWGELLKAGTLNEETDLNLIDEYMLSSLIDVDQGGGWVKDWKESAVWTGVTPGGVGSGWNCNDWTDASDGCEQKNQADIGLAVYKDHNWVQVNPYPSCEYANCSNEYRLYCVQVALED